MPCSYDIILGRGGGGGGGGGGRGGGEPPIWGDQIRDARNIINIIL